MKKISLLLVILLLFPSLCLAQWTDLSKNYFWNGDEWSLWSSSSGPTVYIASTNPGTGSNDLGKAEDAVHSSGDVGVMSLAVRDDTPTGLASDGNYIPFTTDDLGALWTHKFKSGTRIDTGNSTTTPLGGGGTFVGTGVDCLGVTTVSIMLATDVDSATDGMTLQFSPDNTNWDDTYIFEMDVSESGTRRFQFPVTGRFFRVNYTNGGTIQAFFRVQTLLHSENLTTSIHRLKDNVSEDRSATIVKSVIFAQQAGGGDDFIAVQATNGGNFKVSLEETEAGANNISKDEDTAHVDADQGASVWGVRQDADGSSFSDDGDYTPFQMDANGYLKTEMFDGGDSHTVDQGAHDNLNANANIQQGDADVSVSNEVYTRGSQSAGSPVDGEVATIQGISGGTEVPISGTVTATPSGVQEIEGDEAEGVDLDTFPVNPIVIAGKAAVTNLISIPTMIGAGAFNVFGIINADTDGDTALIDNSALFVGGDEAHDAADAGNPLKIGGKASATSDPTAVAVGDRVDAYFTVEGRLGTLASGPTVINYKPDSQLEQGGSEADEFSRKEIAINRRGQQIEGVNSLIFTLDNVSVTYDGDPTTATSSAVESWNYRWATLSYELDESGTATDIIFQVEISLDGTNFTKLTNDFLGSLIYDDTSIGTGIEESVTFPIACQKIRIKVITTGTSGSNTFTVANAALYLRN